MRRSKKKEIILRAAAMIENRKEQYCCFAIDRIQRKGSNCGDSALAKEFAEFYNLLDAYDESNSFEFIYYN